MYKVLEQLSAHEEAWVFKDRVDESFAPNYYIVIRRPMYICKVSQQLVWGLQSIHFSLCINRIEKKCQRKLC